MHRPVSLALLLCVALPACAVPLQAVIVGGGPSKDYNQVALESNVRYVRSLLPPQTPVQTLWADGANGGANVLFTDGNGTDHYRPTTLTGIDGPLRVSALRRAFVQAAQKPSVPLLLYFTGHGSPGERSYEDNAFDLWDDRDLSVSHLSQLLALLPAQQPVTLIMAQCYSGAFANAQFVNGDPRRPLSGRPLCGFFASVDNREAAGCTSEVNEADYQDFTGYFFAALSGRGRTGKPVTGADYNHDGRIGMDEAFCYTLIHDPSIDTPVCTSDALLRRLVPVRADAPLFQKSYKQVRGWADPARGAVLDVLSARLRLQGDTRLTRAYAVFALRTRRAETDESETQEQTTAKWIRFVRTAKTVMLAHALLSSGTAAQKAQFAALRGREAQNPLIATP